MKYNKCNSFYRYFDFYIISPGRISGVASHSHGVSSLSLQGEEWLVLGCHCKWHLCKWHERSLVFVINIHQASAMAQVRGQSDPAAPWKTNEAPWGMPLGGGSAALLQCWLQGTCKHGHVWNPMFALQCVTLLETSCSLWRFSSCPETHNESPKLTPCDSNTACLGEGGIILK